MKSRPTSSSMDSRSGCREPVGFVLFVLFRDFNRGLLDLSTSQQLFMYSFVLSKHERFEVVVRVFASKQLTDFSRSLHPTSFPSRWQQLYGARTC